MNEVERYIDRFPEYRFYGIEVHDNKYYGQVEDDGGVITIYINTLQPEWLQIHTILHESGHAMFDVFGDENSRWCRETMLAEKPLSTLSIT